MTKQQWQLHSMTTGPHDRTSCPQCKARLATRRKNAGARAREDAYRSAGLVKVRGAVSGSIYWE